MRLPWSKRIEEAEAQALGAAMDHAQSVERRMQSEKTREEAVEVTEVLWKELRRNGWTEMLQQSMRGGK
ncbi:hypothetical protein CH278_02195 [Rhodococcus sp. 05-2254-5]|jgi:hypothetical protein|uniref:DUF7620 family protein n=1 Tax=unclassified Rhodococcus (in: high G+C Gram-positive bacteria) TaxID=192944 RepID=UPI000B9B11E9|nr:MULTISPECIES: hypothetical protein [unclassified Rhodococcus (in: high G+C Gram-positive bacteria)]OZE39114.1 hypothetical protein CH278_02195 [Rhodococcus sp. 05-2254-5]OZE59055.1 hypothetical protein CH269_08690 [Rhodococcus sp. 05-2254-1]